MRTRFLKVWCDSCKSMQFAGECPHGRVIDARVVGGKEEEGLSKFDRWGLYGRNLPSSPLLPNPYYFSEGPVHGWDPGAAGEL